MIPMKEIREQIQELAKRNNLPIINLPKVEAEEGDISIPVLNKTTKEK